MEYPSYKNIDESVVRFAYRRLEHERFAKLNVSSYPSLANKLAYEFSKAKVNSKKITYPQLVVQFSNLLPRLKSRPEFFMRKRWQE